MGTEEGLRGAGRPQGGTEGCWGGMGGLWGCLGELRGGTGAAQGGTGGPRGVGGRRGWGVVAVGGTRGWGGAAALFRERNEKIRGDPTSTIALWGGRSWR